MRIINTSGAANVPLGYSMWLSARDTYNWARKPGAAWPGSSLADHRLFIGVDSNGLCEITLDGHQFNGDPTELDACVADHLPEEYRHLWPVWARPIK